MPDTLSTNALVRVNNPLMPQFMIGPSVVMNTKTMLGIVLLCPSMMLGMVGCERTAKVSEVRVTQEARSQDSKPKNQAQTLPPRSIATH